MTIGEIPPKNSIFGIEGSGRNAPYNDVNEVLNTIGVMCKRNKVPSLQVLKPQYRRKPPFQYHTIGKEYYVPINWRDYLYEDLETGHYYIVSPDPNNEKQNPMEFYSWIVFQVTGITLAEKKRSYDSKIGLTTEMAYHSGTFVDLFRNHDKNEVLDTLSRTRRPINIHIIDYLDPAWGGKIRGYIYKFDI